MKKAIKILALLLISVLPIVAQTSKNKKMEKKVFSPWKWQDDKSYVQAVEVKNVQSTLYVSGQAAMDDQGVPSDADMKSQLIQAIQNLEKVITHAGYTFDGIVRLNIYTTSVDELWPHFSILQSWLAKNNVKQATSLIQVTRLTETLKVELEATVVK
ncbi:RidA family protein [Pedobacter sp. UYP1]|uniref:RidA family protein n=1 Tax=Pedobacter sp. UYP1 TaxID=1756396 RepID=UPI003399A7BD